MSRKLNSFSSLAHFRGGKICKNCHVQIIYWNFPTESGLGLYGACKCATFKLKEFFEKILRDFQTQHLWVK